MSLKSVVLTGTNSWRVPPGVSFGWVNCCAPGGAGQSSNNTQLQGGSGGGAGEFCLGMPVPLTPGTYVSLSAGTPGQGGNNAAGSTAGSASTFAGFQLLPGNSVANTLGTNFAGMGGGPAATNTSTMVVTDPGFAGNQESPTAWSGASGGMGEGLSVSHGGAGGQQIGQYSAPQTNNSGAAHPGGAGGSGVFGSGGYGADGSASHIGGQAGTGYGGGSSGMASNATTDITANGDSGVLMIFYIAP